MSSPASPRILIIGAGSRGNNYARAIHSFTCGTVAGIAEPLPWKRRDFAKRYAVSDDMVFCGWEELLEHEGRVKERVDGVCVCTLDETHVEIVTALRPLDLHVLCEKPLATNIEGCRKIYDAVVNGGTNPIVFAVGHVLRYSPHNLLLRRLLLDEAAVGEIVNINHTEPVGWWHFTHSYVRGNWRTAKTSAPSLLTKCCHDIDLLLWFLCYPTSHFPSRVSSHGSLVAFKPSRKPPAAGPATNCFSCAAEPDCMYSARKIYIEHNLKTPMSTGWPNKIVAPEIEDAPNLASAEQMLTEKLKEDYTTDDGGRPYYGRCVFEAGNDVVDNQVVTLEWDDKDAQRTAKTATLTMIAHSERICERFTKVYGTRGELTADSRTVEVYDFATGERKTYNPESINEKDSHGGGDVGLARGFVEAVRVVLEGGEVGEAQRKWVGCTPQDVLMSHEVVFWAEEARVGKKVLDWVEGKGKANGENSS